MNRIAWRTAPAPVGVAAVVLLACGESTAPVPMLTIAPANDTLLFVGETVTLTASFSGIPAGTVIWQGGDPVVAEVSALGVVTAIGNGVTHVVATGDSLADTATIVVEIRPALVAVMPALDTLTSINDTTTLTATVQDAGGTPIPDAPVAWTTSNGAAAAVSGGTVTAIANGTTTITARTGGVAGSSTIVVQQQPANIQIAGVDSLFAINATAQLTATIIDSGGSTVPGAAVNWVSRSSTVAPVTALGLVSAADNGTTKIVASHATLSDSITVTVHQRTRALTITPPVGELFVGLPFTVTVQVFDSLGTPVRVALTDFSLATELNPHNAVLTGTTAVTPVNGVATFSGLTLSRVGRGVTLRTIGSGYTVATAPLDVLIRFTSIQAGIFITCGLVPPGDAYCWGRNETGGLGTGSAGGPVTRPARVGGGLTFTQLATGSGSNINGFFDGSACGLTAAGAAWCWGRNDNGQLGDGSSTDRMLPVEVAGGLTFTRLVSGGEHVCGLTAAQQVYCWGDNASGQLGNGNNTGVDANVPVLVAGTRTYANVFAGDAQTCAFGTDTFLYCWHSTNNLVGPTIFQPTLATDNNVAFTDVAPARFLNMCGITAAGAGYCWGQDLNDGALGNGLPNTNQAQPTLIAGAHAWSRIGTGTQRACGLRTDGVVMCWGLSFSGALGQGPLSDYRSTTPVAVAGGLTFTSLFVGSSTACGLIATGAAYCWGGGAHGVLGNGATESVGIPTRVGTP